MWERCVRRVCVCERGVCVCVCERERGVCDMRECGCMCVVCMCVVLWCRWLSSSLWGGMEA